MKTIHYLYCGMLCASLLAAGQARANVYATNIKLNGDTNGVSIKQGESVGVSFILNEDATGVDILLMSGTNLVAAAGYPNPPRGSNYVTFDAATGYPSSYAPPGTYSIRVIAAGNSHPTWTQIRSDTDPGTYVWEPRGLAVNKNTNSFYYGRVFASNATGNSAGSLPGDSVGIIKANADGSFADDGAFSTGGYPWAGDFFSPWKMEVGDDDKLYVNDWTGNGIILAFDQEVSPSYLSVLRDDNNPNGVANMTGPFVTGSSNGMQIWMADVNYTTPPGTGITRWTVTADGTLAPGDTGTQIVAALTGSLKIYPYDIAVDKNGYIYTIQYRVNPGDPASRVLRFPPYNESGTPETVADWAVGSGDDTMRGAFACAVDPTATYVAVAFRTGSGGSGGVAILDANTGALIKRDLVPLDDYREVAWDNVGNLYVADNAGSLWRAFSPPASPCTFSAPAMVGTNFQFTVSGPTNQLYNLSGSTNLTTWRGLVGGSIAGGGAIKIHPSTAASFYRATAINSAMTPAIETLTIVSGP